MKWLTARQTGLVGLLLVGLGAAEARAELPPGALRLTPPALLGSGGDAPAMEERLMRTQLISSSGTALVAVPVALLAGSLAGMISNELVLAALPAVLLYLLVPPAAAAFAAWTVGKRSGAVRPGFWGAFGMGVATHFLITTAAVLLFGTSSRGYLGAAVLSVVDAAALGSVTTFWMDRQAVAKVETPAVAPQAGARPIVTLPLVAGSF